MPLPCPVCRAVNDAGPTCRRCRADLSLVVAIERQRDYALTAARHAATLGRWDEATAQVRHACGLRRGPDAEQLLAALCLGAGDFAAAWRHYRHSVS